MHIRENTNMIHAGQPYVVLKVYLRSYCGALHPWVELQSRDRKRHLRFRFDILQRNLLSGRTRYVG